MTDSKRSFRLYGWVTILVAVGLAQSIPAIANNCVTASLVSGSKCNDLKVKFDASKCDGEDETREVTSHCENGLAVAKWRGVDGSYTASFKEKEAGWGEKSWESEGTVSVSKNTVKKRNPYSSTWHEPKTNKYEYTATHNTSPSKPLLEVIPTVPVPHSPQASAHEPEKTDRQPAAQAPVESPLKFSGYLDVYYTYNSNKPANDLTRAAGSTQNPGQNGPRYYDIYHDQISLNQAEVSLSKDAAPVGFRVDLAFGQWAEQNVVNDEVSKHIPQAYLTYKPEFFKNFTLDIGKMYTHMGLEVAHAQDNFNYSRSLLYGYSIPFWHTGIKGTYALIPDKATAAFAVYNGWQTSLNDNNSGKSFGGQLSVTPVEGLTAIYNIITGPELNNDNDTIRTAHDFNVSWTVSPKFTIAGDLVYGYENQGALSKVWSSAELLAKYSLTDWYSLSPRFEVYNDKKDEIGSNGSLGLGATTTVWNATLTNSFSVGHGLEFRLEARYDKASQPVYLGATKDSQWTFTWAGLLKF